jgi:hypothetical protein
MDSRGIPIVVQTTKKAPTTPSRNPLTPKRHDIPSSPYVYTNLKDEKSLLDAYDSFADACFQSHYNHSMLTEDCRYNIHDLFKSDCYATENNTSSVPDSPKLNHSQNKRMRSTLTIDIDPAEAQVPTLETCKRLKADSSMFTKMDIVSSPIEATTPMGEDMEEALDTIMNTATLKQQKHQEGFTTEEESNKANTILTTTMKEAILHNSTYSVEQLNNQEGSVTLKTSSTDHKMDTPEKSSPDIDNCVQIDPIADSSKKSAVVEVLKVVAKVPADPVTKDPGTTTKTSVKEGPSTPTKESVKKDPDTPTKKPAVTRRVTRSQIKDKKIEFAVPELPRSRKKASPKKKKTPETSTKEADEPVVSQTEKISNQTVAPIETKVKEADEPVVSQTEEISNQTVAPIETKVKESEVKTELSNEEVERRKYEAQKKEKIKKEIRNLLERFPSLADYYQLIDRTGCGTFSKVYKAKDLRADQYVALDQNSACQQEQGSEHVAIKLILDISTPERVANEIQCLLLLR